MQEGALGPVGWNVLEEKGSQQRGPPVFALLCCGLVLIDFLDYVCIELSYVLLNVAAVLGVLYCWRRRARTFGNCFVALHSSVDLT